MKKALKRHGSPEKITTDGLRSYRAAMNELGNAEKQEFGRWANNRVENSHLSFRRRERAMLRFRRMKTCRSSPRSMPTSTITSTRNATSSIDRLTKLAARPHCRVAVAHELRMRDRGTAAPVRDELRLD